MARSTRTASKTASTSTTAKEATSMTSFDNFIAELHDLTAKYLSGEADAETTKAAVEESAKPAAKTAAKKTAAKKAPAKKAEPVEDEDDAEDDAPAEVDYSKLSIAKLRKLVIEAGFDPEDVKGADKETLIDALTDPDAAADEDEDEDEDDDTDPTPDADDEADDEDEDEGEDEDELTREDLEGMTVAALRKMARDDYDATPAEVKGLDKESLIDFIMDDAEDEDADEDGIEDDEEGYTEDELAEMTADELREVCDEWDIEYSPKARTKTLIKLILESQEEVDEDDE